MARDWSRRVVEKDLVRASLEAPTGLAEDRADADENQISHCDHHGKFDNQHRDAEENLNYAEGDAGGG
jgi:hypothetical protein